MCISQTWIEMTFRPHRLFHRNFHFGILEMTSQHSILRLQADIAFITMPSLVIEKAS